MSGVVDPATHLRVLALSVLVAGLLQLAWTLAALRSARLSFTLRDPDAWSEVRSTLLGVGPMMLGLGVLQINIVVDGLIASWPSIVGPTILGFDYPLEAGAMTALTNAARLYEFPLGVFGIAIATAIFPALSRQNNDPVAFVATLRRGLRMSLFIGLPASAGLVLVSQEAVGVLFQRGAFDASDTVRVAWVLAAFAPGIWAYQSVHILSRAFYAMKLPTRPLRIALAMVALNLALNLTLIFTPLRESGLAWSTSICAALQALLLCRSLSRDVPALLDRELQLGVLRSVIATVAMTLAVVAVSRVLPTGLVPSEMLVSLAAKITVGAAVFALAARLLRMPELGWTIGRRGSALR